MCNVSSKRTISSVHPNICNQVCNLTPVSKTLHVVWGELTATVFCCHRYVFCGNRGETRHSQMLLPKQKGSLRGSHTRFVVKRWWCLFLGVAVALLRGNSLLKNCIFDRSYFYFFFCCTSQRYSIGPSLRLCFRKKSFFALKHLDQLVVHSISYWFLLCLVLKYWFSLSIALSIVKWK